MSSGLNEDFLDCIVRLEETHIQQGFDEGYEKGLVSGREDARHLGLKLGFETGELIGFYKGCSFLWNSALRVDPTRFSPQLHKHLNDFHVLLVKFPLLDPEDEAKDRIKDHLRVKFNIICASLGVSKKQLEWSEEMLREMLGCCKVYISEARNKTALEAIERAVKPFPPAAIVNKFEDAAYGRVGYTVVSSLATGSSSSLKNAVFAMVKTALDTINLELHSGSHPRLGVVDHICFHPLSQTSIEQVSSVANSLAMDIGSTLRVPTYLYGAADKEQCTLDSIRRKLGYFKANREGHEWAGGLELEMVPVKPDAGPQEVSKAKGVVAVGACGWVSNYNVPVMSNNLKAVRRLSRKTSERGGGLASVQTMALVHGEGVIEVACNLLNPSQVGGDEVQGLIERLGREEGLLVGKWYYTDYTPDQIAQRYIDLLNNSKFSK
ncbi:PREDICTED: formimidoyltransferase-cyclodeaminase-like isoform X1 [Camelina sativa]|uniref:Formimidoyltransferase-cyclodeaminase-like isoform X1 n=1 Tax=Camelina sativa TaxID=90675 RepID=A0ABM0W9T9_CAMSA|nr:PREDICTED: formimidoyltransferase-cyclodeaminase-like isoform X1 [Camelina sativa]